MNRAIESVHSRLSGAPTGASVAIAGAGIAVVGVLDVVTGPEISFSVFYVGPIAVTAMYAGAMWGLTACVTAATVWYLADPIVYSAPWIPVWNAAVRLAFFVLVTLFIVRLRDLLDRLRSLADTDTRTGLPNARHFERSVEAEITRAKRYGGSTSLVYVDLDGFKAVNDRWGHATGDHVLEAVGKVLTSRLRASDVPARLGGDEFAVLLPQTDGPSASTVIQNLRAHLEQAVGDGGWPVGFSMGIVTASGGVRSAAELIRLADDLMYEVKRGGKGTTLAKSAEPEGPAARG